MTPDVNVLVAASRKDHPHHIPAINWLENAIDTRPSARPLAILPMVASGFLRLVTHPRVFIEPTPIKSAQSFVHVLLGSPSVQLIQLGEEWSLFEQLCLKHELKGNDIPDAWIAAAAQTNHLHLVTFDKGFRKLMKTGLFTVLKPND